MHDMVTAGIQAAVIFVVVVVEQSLPAPSFSTAVTSYLPLAHGTAAVTSLAVAGVTVQMLEKSTVVSRPHTLSGQVTVGFTAHGAGPVPCNKTESSVT